MIRGRFLSAECWREMCNWLIWLWFIFQIKLQQMSKHQFEIIMAAFQSLTKKVDGFESRFDGIDSQLLYINEELRRIEPGTQYKANQDIIDKLAAIR